MTGKIITIANFKGGVGKTTIAWALSLRLSLGERARVLAIDCDPSGNLTNVLTSLWEHRPFNGGWERKGRVPLSGLRARDLLADAAAGSPMQSTHGIDLIHTKPNSTPEYRFYNQALPDMSPIKRFVERVRGYADEYDFIVIDTPLSTGNQVIASLYACDHVIIPLDLAPYAERSSENVIAQLRGMGRLASFMGFAVNDADRNSAEHGAAIKRLRGAAGSGDKVFSTVIYHSPSIFTAISHNRPVGVCGGWKARENVDAFVDEALARMGCSARKRVKGKGRGK